MTMDDEERRSEDKDEDNAEEDMANTFSDNDLQNP